MLRERHIGIARHSSLPQTEIAKKGKVVTLPLSRSLKTAVRTSEPYLVFASSFFSGAGAASFIGSPGLVSPAGAAGSAGAAGAGAGGGGGAGSSFLPHPTNVRVKAKRVIADNEISFFPILIHLLSRHTSVILCLLSILYRTCRSEIQAQLPPKLLPPCANRVVHIVDDLAALRRQPARLKSFNTVDETSHEFLKPCHLTKRNILRYFLQTIRHARAASMRSSWEQDDA